MKLIIIEGIPGSGKTTISKKIYDFYQAKNLKVKLYQEGDLHPTDLAWCSILTHKQYNDFINGYPEKESLLKTHSKPFEDQYIVAFTKLNIAMKDPIIKELFEPNEFNGSSVGYERYTSIHRKLWHDFLTTDHEDDIIIFECPLLQNHVNELLITFESTKENIHTHLLSLIPEKRTCDIDIIYLDNPDVKETICRVAKERVSPDKSKWDDWIDLVMKYIAESPYGRSNDVNCLEDVYDYFKLRKSIEMDILKDLPVNQHIIPNPNYNWDEVWTSIKHIL